MREIIYILFIINCSVAFAQHDTVIYNSHGRVIAEGKVKNGLRVGQWQEYDWRGNLERKIIYVNGNIIEVWSYNTKKGCVGKMYSINHITQYKGYDVENGLQIEFFCNGNVKFLGYSKNGMAYGEQRIYYESGGVESIYYCDGKGHYAGWYQSFYENGNLKGKGKYENDLKIDEWVTYYENGQLKSKGNYYPKMKRIPKNTDDVDKLWQITDSLITAGHENFILPLILYFKNGKWQYWNEEGKLVKEEYYHKGKLQEKE